jgi:hypothetical protein
MNCGHMSGYLTIDFFVDSFLALVDCPHMLGHVTLNMENVLPIGRQPREIVYLSLFSVTLSEANRTALQFIILEHDSTQERGRVYRN